MFILETRLKMDKSFNRINIRDIVHRINVKVNSTPAAVSIDDKQHYVSHLTDTISTILTVHTPQTVCCSRCATKGKILQIRDNDNRRRVGNVSNEEYT